MPIYEYACSACGHRTDILHGVHDEGPAFCPSCGAEGTMRKAFAPPAIVFKGTGWAKKERRSSATGSKSREGGDGTGGSADAGKDKDGGSSGGSAGSTGSGATTGAGGGTSKNGTGGTSGTSASGSSAD
jgi:putative FmdB family regulatory protein